MKEMHYWGYEFPWDPRFRGKVKPEELVGHTYDTSGEDVIRNFLLAHRCGHLIREYIERTDNVAVTLLEASVSVAEPGSRQKSRESLLELPQLESFSPEARKYALNEMRRQMERNDRRNTGEYRAPGRKSYRQNTLF